MKFPIKLPREIRKNRKEIDKKEKRLRYPLELAKKQKDIIITILGQKKIKKMQISYSQSEKIEKKIRKKYEKLIEEIDIFRFPYEEDLEEIIEDYHDQIEQIKQDAKLRSKKKTKNIIGYLVQLTRDMLIGEAAQERKELKNDFITKVSESSEKRSKRIQKYIDKLAKLESIYEEFKREEEELEEEIARELEDEEI